MVICFQCTPDTKRKLDALVSRGDYADYAEVIAASVANQAVLSERMSGKSELVFASANEVRATTSGILAQERSDSSVARLFTPPSGNGPAKVHVPPLFSAAGLDGDAPDPADQPQDDWKAGSVVPANRWLWGQFNRFLPAKASCRALARLQIKTQTDVLLAEAAPLIAEAATELGDYLTEFDRRFNLKRDEAVATAFPHTGPDLWKARQRYAGQFVGSVNTEGVLSGMLIDLKLLNWRVANDGVRVRLTDVGWNFSRLINPILDKELVGPGPRLSVQEIDLMVNHIHRWVRPEDFAYHSLLQAISSGINTPDALDDAVEAANRKETPQMSRAFVSTQRSGAIARMADLGLITRLRTGLAVTYAITERGRGYLNQS